MSKQILLKAGQFVYELGEMRMSICYFYPRLCPRRHIDLAD